MNKIEPAKSARNPDKSIRVINPYHEDYDHNDDLDLETQRSSRCWCRRKIENGGPLKRVRPGQRWSVDSSVKLPEKGHRKTFGANSRQPHSPLSSAIVNEALAQVSDESGFIDPSVFVAALLLMSRTWPQSLLHA